MLSILTVSYNCLDFIRLLVLSVRRFSSWPHEIIVIDNASEDGTAEWLKLQPDIRAELLTTNIKHGPGLDMALKMASGKYCLVLDADAHLQRAGFEDALLALYKTAPDVKLVAAKGTHDPLSPGAKPIHAAFMFFETQFFRNLELSFIARDGHDVGRKIFYDLRAICWDTVRVGPRYEAGCVKFYPGSWGDDYYIDGKPTIYHNWYSSRMWNVADKVDSYERAEFDRRKEILFSQPLVREILGDDSTKDGT